MGGECTPILKIALKNTGQVRTPYNLKKKKKLFAINPNVRRPKNGMRNLCPTHVSNRPYDLLAAHRNFSKKNRFFETQSQDFD